MYQHSAPSRRGSPHALAAHATMATATKRLEKVSEFVAHGSAVNCLQIGRKSGSVMVTGGDDKKVNVWAIGKANAIMVRASPPNAVVWADSFERIAFRSLRYRAFRDTRALWNASASIRMNPL